MKSKNRIIKYSLLLIILFTISLDSFSQTQLGEKYEKEIRIKKEDFPIGALTTINPIIKEDKRSRYYKEINKNSYSYEYKSIFKKKKISIKFDQNGRLEDIEVKQDISTISEEIKSQMLDYFNNNFKKYKLNKIQFQYTSDIIENDSIFIKNFLERELSKLTLKYEIECEVVDLNKERGYFEFLFGAKGEVEKVQKIIPRADDNILY